MEAGIGIGEAVFDTNILIDFLNQVPGAAAELLRYERRYISQITWMEVMVGVKPADEPATREFLKTFHLLRITDPVAEEAVAIRQAQRLKLPDAIVLATARLANVMLVTRNPKDFAQGSMIRIPNKL